MVGVYASLVIKSKKTIAEVPEKIRDAVKQELIDRGYPDLANGGDTD